MMRTTSTWKGGSKPKRGAKSRRIAQPKNPILIIFKRKEIRSLTSVVAGTFQQRDKSRTKHEVTAFADCAMGIHLEYKLGKNLSPRVVSFPGGLTKNDVYAAVSEKYKKLQDFANACMGGQISKTEKRYVVNDLSALPVAINHIGRLRCQPNGILDDPARREGLYLFIRLVAKFPMVGLNIEGIAHAASVLEMKVLPNWPESMGFCNVDRALITLCQQCTQQDSSQHCQRLFRTAVQNPEMEVWRSFSDVTQAEHKIFTEQNLYLAKSLSPICAYNAGNPPLKHDFVDPERIEHIIRARNV